MLVTEENQIDPVKDRTCELPGILQLHERIVYHERMVMEEKKDALVPTDQPQDPLVSQVERDYQQARE